MTLIAIRRTLSVAGAGLAAWLVVGYADGLRAAGLNGSPPPNSGAFKTFVDSITDNAVWVVGTCVVLAIVAIGGLFFFGHSRAQDYAAKVAAGVALIVLGPGIAA